MSSYKFLCAVLLVVSYAAGIGLAHAQVVITETKVEQGNITPGDDPGFPARLSLSGSYVLGSNLRPGTNLDAIVVAAPDVTIDFNGFKIFGGPAGGANNGRFGIYSAGDRLTVKDGTIASFKGNGIHAPDRLYLVVQNMRIIQGGTSGIYTGDMALIRNSIIALNVATGIICGRSCHMEGNIISNNGGRGLSIINGTALGNTVFSNGSYGLWASSFALESGFGNNTISKNYGGDGVQVMGGWISLEANNCNGNPC